QSRVGLLDPSDVVRVDVARLVGRRDGLPEALADELQHAGVDLLSLLVAHDEEGRALDSQPRAEHHAGTLGVVLVRPHDLVDPVPEAARLEMLRRLGALTAVGAVPELLLHHGDVHGPGTYRPPGASGKRAQPTPSGPCVVVALAHDRERGLVLGRRAA